MKTDSASPDPGLSSLSLCGQIGPVHGTNGTDSQKTMESPGCDTTVEVTVLYSENERAHTRPTTQNEKNAHAKEALYIVHKEGKQGGKD